MNPFEPDDPRHAMMVRAIEDADRIWGNDLTNRSSAIYQSLDSIQRVQVMRLTVFGDAHAHRTIIEAPELSVTTCQMPTLTIYDTASLDRLIAGLAQLRERING